MQKTTVKSTDFIRALLIGSIGTVMIEWEAWGFPDPPLSRGFFNDRLKKTAPVNKLTRQRLYRLFETIFSPENRTGTFQESKAVDVANEIIRIINDFFDVNISVWKNSHAGNNRASRHHLLACLEIVFSSLENKDEISAEEVHNSLLSYLDKFQNNTQMSSQEYPVFLRSLPSHQTEHYIGRDKQTEDISKLLLSGTSCILYGIGGIGKTEIAKSVVKNIQSIPSAQSGITHIMWVSCTDGSFTLSLVRSLGLKDSVQDLEKSFHEAVSTINSFRDRLLLIIDNVEDEKDEVLLSICDYLNCRILITSRIHGFANLKEFPVNPLPMDNCKELFYSYYHGLQNDILVQNIIELADRHTVTIELLSKIADCEETSLSEFYESLIRCGFHISSEEASSAHEKLQSEARIIQQLQKLFRVYALKEDERILLIRISAIPNIPFRFPQASKWFCLSNRSPLNHLEKRGWLKKEIIYNAREKYRYSIHSVIAAAVRAQFMEELYSICEYFIKEITIEMEQSANSNDAAKKELIQFSWSLNDIFQNDFKSIDDSKFLWALAEIYRDIGYYEKALPMLNSLLKLYAALFGENCIQLASVYNSLGMIYYSVSHFSDALASYQMCYDIMNAHTAADHLSDESLLDLARLELNIGEVYLKTDYTKAEPYFDHAYKVFSSQTGNDSHLTLTALGHKAKYLHQLGKWQEAEAIFLDIYGKSSGNPSRDIRFLRADAAHHLGNIYSDYLPEQAMPYLEEARDIFMELLSLTHPDTLDVLNTICTLRLSTEDDYPDILENLQELLRQFIKAYGINDPNTATIYDNIGLCLYYMGQWDDAISNYREAIRIDKECYGADHESIAYIYNNIGAVYSDSDRPELAIPEHNIALTLLEQAHPDSMNLDLAQTHSDLADAYLRIGDGDNVVEHLNKALEIYEQMLPENARQFLSPYSILANYLVAIKDYENAIQVYGNVINIMLANGYAEDSSTVQEFAQRIEEVQKMSSTE